MLTYAIIVFLLVAIIGAIILFNVAKRNMLNDWRNHLIQGEPIVVKCHYFVEGKPRYIYIPATVGELVDDEHYKVMYDPDHLNEAIEDYIDDGLQIPEDVHHNYICKPMSDEQLETLNTKWDLNN